MTASLYLTSAEGHTGKSMIALGLLNALQEAGKKVGVFRPVVRSAGEVDGVLNHLLSHANAEVAPEACIGVTYDDVHTDPNGSLSRIIAAYHAMEGACDLVLVLGSDYTDVSTPTEFAYNARIAANLAAPVLLILGGRALNAGTPANSQFLSHAARSEHEIRQVAEVALAELAAEHADVMAIIVNRVEEAGLDAAIAAVNGALGDGSSVPVFAMPEDPVLVAPTLRDLSTSLQGALAFGDDALLDKEVLGYVISAMSMENVLKHLTEDAAVVVPGDRSEVLLGVLMAQESETFPNIAGILMNGGFEVSETVGSLIRGLPGKTPIVSIPFGTFDTSRLISQTRAGLGTATPRKTAAAIEAFKVHVDSAKLASLAESFVPATMTPLAFEYNLITRAAADRKHIVLPEGDDDRILIAAAEVLARGAADLTILGDESGVRAAADRLGVDISAAKVIAVTDPEMVETFAQEYARVRAHKGMTVEKARTIVTDVSYFGTMMVHLGMADGMVSGAAHTTAHTIKPSFEVIKTRPGISIVSSIFFMSLPDKVLVYGDCAVNPNPTAEQLADIAISSAESAKQFGIEPRVAMLSYSTGESGHGDAVDKVREATRLVRERAADLLVEGPIQYDAATDAAVASSKMPGSDVAGKATVFIFPDLNTGNNTYKAVQRSAGAVAVGPMLQGLNKPINDLSRGALVKDIVNTIAITAIQAQAQGKQA